MILTNADAQKWIDAGVLEVAFVEKYLVADAQKVFTALAILDDKNTKNWLFTGISLAIKGKEARIKYTRLALV